MPKNNNPLEKNKHQKEIDKILNPDRQGELNFVEVQYERFKDWISKRTDSKAMRYTYSAIAGFLAAGSFVGICVATGGIPLAVVILAGSAIFVISGLAANKGMNNIQRTKKLEAAAKANAAALDTIEEAHETHETQLDEHNTSINQHANQAATYRKLADIFARHIPKEAKEDKIAAQTLLDQLPAPVTKHFNGMMEFEADLPPDLIDELTKEEPAKSQAKHEEKAETQRLISKSVAKQKPARDITPLLELARENRDFKTFFENHRNDILKSKATQATASATVNQDDDSVNEKTRLIAS